jgi:putative ABC transport system ATP-binding protein
MMNTMAVRCDGLVHIYRSAATEVVALRDVDLAVEEGESVALLGPSGAGKSTLLWLLAGLLRPSAGRLWVHGREISRLSLRELDRLRAQQIGVVLQNPARNLIPHATAAHNIAFAQRAGPARRRERHRRIGELLEAVGLLGVAHRVAGRLSGGEQQRLAVAVALANWPRLVLADEPTSQLDHASALSVVELLSTAVVRFGATVVVVTHDPAVSDAFDRTVTIRDGRVGAEGRRGDDYVVIGRDGSVQLPPELHGILPPGARARVAPTPDGVRLIRADSESEPR